MNANVNPNEDTEFHDALRKHGIIPPKPASRSPSPDLPTDAEQRQTLLQKASLADIDRMLETNSIVGRTGNGGDEDDQERLLLHLRRQRIQALDRERKAFARFGRVYPISRPDYAREVTEASKEDPQADAESDGENEEDYVETGAGTLRSSGDGSSSKEPKQRRGTGVVCFLYKDSIEECRLLAGYLDHLAGKHPSTKFVSIIGDQCIPNYPDRNLPTLLVYRNGELHRQIIGLRPEIGLDGIKTKCADIELLLTAIGVIDPSTNPGSDSNQATDDDVSMKSKSQLRLQGREEMEDEDEGFGANNRKYDRPSVRSQEEEDADLDWDL